MAVLAFVGAGLWLGLRKSADAASLPRQAVSPGIQVKAPVSPAPRAAALPRPTAARPLKIFFDGDSVAGLPSLSFAKQAKATGVMKAIAHYHTSTRLADPQNIGWLTHVRSVIRSNKVHAVVFMIGANDPGMPINGNSNFWSKTWYAAYRKRVGGMMDAMLAAGAKRVYWVGMPIMSPGGYPSSEQMRRLNFAFRKEASLRPGKVRYVDIWRLLATNTGAYDPKWRAGDGVHLTWAAGDRVARAVMRHVKADWLPAR